jgi:hypothetical protein
MTVPIMKTAIITGALLLALAGRAFAQPGMTEPGLEPLPPPPPAQVPAGEELSEGTALALSLGGTAGSWALLIGSPLVGIGGGNEEAAALMGTAGSLGIVLAPSFGHWYAGKYLTRGLGLRLGGGALMITGLIVALMEEPLSFGHDDEEDDDGDAVYGPAIAIAGVGMFVWGTIDDIVTAPGRVRRLNRERAGIAVAPIVTQHSAGFALAGRF